MAIHCISCWLQQNRISLNEPVSLPDYSIRPQQAEKPARLSRPVGNELNYCLSFWNYNYVAPLNNVHNVTYVSHSSRTYLVTEAHGRGSNVLLCSGFGIASTY